MDSTYYSGLTFTDISGAILNSDNVYHHDDEYGGNFRESYGFYINSLTHSTYRISASFATIAGQNIDYSDAVITLDSTLKTRRWYKAVLAKKN